MVLLSACGVQQHISTSLENWDPHAYTVSQGDTLYSIAWRYDKDHRDLARWNTIQPPYTIYPGQRLSMTEPAQRVQPPSETQPQEQLNDGATESPVTTAAVMPPPDYSNPQNIPTPPPLNRPVPAKPPTLNPTPTSKPLHLPVDKPKPVKNGEINWLWPLKGKVVTTFAANNTKRKGIDIRSGQNAEVKAAADGEIVYSGNALLNYGNLVIIKHNDSYLSAYAHNRKLLVKEGNFVQKGQKIALVGGVSNVKNYLHFEIRKDGKPVNPLNYLPKF